MGKSRIPPQHPLAPIALSRLDPINYLPKWFSKETYIRAYQYLVSPLRKRMFRPISDKGPFLPTIVKRMPANLQNKKERIIRREK